MKWVFSISIVIFLFSGASAQADIFVRQHEKPAESAREESKKSWTGIFLRPFKRDKPKEQNKSVVRRSQDVALDYTRRINVLRQQQAELAESFRRLSYWTNSGRKPETAAEVLSYADAHRAPARLAMLEARNKRMASIKARKKRQRQEYQLEVLAKAPNPDAVIALNIAKLEAKRAVQQSVVRVPGVARTDKSAPRVRQIYRRSTNNAPARVFNDSR